jgi:hypothetical protein
MSPRRIALLLASTLCTAAPAPAQVAVGGGIGYGSPVIVVPVPIVVPLASDRYAYPGVRAPGVAPSCLRIGRCTPSDLEVYYSRPEALERRAPGASGPSGDAPFETRIFAPGVKATPEDEVRPEYRGASLPREEFEASGKPLASPR